MLPRCVSVSFVPCILVWRRVFRRLRAHGLVPQSRRCFVTAMAWTIADAHCSFVWPQVVDAEDPERQRGHAGDTGKSISQYPRSISLLYHSLSHYLIIVVSHMTLMNYLAGIIQKYQHYLTIISTVSPQHLTIIISIISQLSHLCIATIFPLSSSSRQYIASTNITIISMTSPLSHNYITAWCRQVSHNYLNYLTLISQVSQLYHLSHNYLNYPTTISIISQLSQLYQSYLTVISQLSHNYLTTISIIS